MSQTENKFKSTTIYGNFKNIDSSDGTILASANFKRDLTVQNNLIIGNEILDSSNNVVSTNGSIIFTINKIIYTLPILTLSYLNTLTSNVQTQINTINTTIQNLNGATNSSMITFTSSLNGMTTTTFNYLKNVSSDVQTQFYNIYNGNNSYGGQNIFTNNTTFWNAITLTNTGNTFINLGNSILTNITFSGSLNGMTTTTFNYLKNVSSDVQTQLNSIINIFTQTNIFTGANTFKNAITFGDSNFNNGLFNAYCSTFYVQGSEANFNNGLYVNNGLRINSNGCYINQGDLTIYGGNIIFNNAIGGISKTVFNYLSGVSSNIQTQFYNIYNGNNSYGGQNIFTNNTTFWNAITLTNTGNTFMNSGNSILTNITFSGSLNNISTTVFSYLSGATSNIQDQLNFLFTASNPVGSIIAHVGLTTTITGYLYCDGSEYLKSTYPNLYSTIGDKFGTISGNSPSNTNYFRIPNYKAIFLRGAGTNTINGSTFVSQSIGINVSDTIRIQSAGDYVNSIAVSKRQCTGDNLGVTIVQDVSQSKSSVVLGNGNETCPVNSSVNYFIKY